MKCKRCKVDKLLLATNRCLDCQKYVEDYYQKNRQQEIDRAKKHQNKDRQKTNEYKRNLNRKNPLSIRLQHAKRRAKLKNIPFNITISDLKIPEKCPILGMTLVVNESYAKENSISLDRIVPELGYVKGNVAVISYKANTIKNNATIEELEKVLSWMKSKMSLNNTISLVLGDWSSDGHGKTDTITLKSNLSRTEVVAAYEAGTKTLGFDFIEKVADEYEDGSLRNPELEILLSHGLNLKDVGIEDEVDEDEGVSLWVETYANIYLFIVKLGNKDFEYEFCGSDSIQIGGYGLFY
jgi:hypothetical protein